MAVWRKLLISAFVLSGVVLLGTGGYMLLEGWPFSDSLYMAIITMSTVGFGEVHSLDAPGRVLTILIIISGLTVAAYALSTITTYLVSGEINQLLRGRRMERELRAIKEHVIVAGYGKLGREVAEGLKDAETPFCVIENDPQKAQQAVDRGMLVVTGDASDDEILQRAGVERAKALVAVLTGDAANVMVTVTARTLNPTLLIAARGGDESSEAKLRRAGANRVELLFQLAGRRLAAVVAKPSLVEFFDIFYRHLGLKLDMGAVVIGENSALVGKTVAESDIRRVTGGAVVMAIKRGETEIILHPSGDDVFRAGDRLLILGSEKNLRKLKEQYQVS